MKLFLAIFGNICVFSGIIQRPKLTIDSTVLELAKYSDTTMLTAIGIVILLVAALQKDKDETDE